MRRNALVVLGNTAAPDDARGVATLQRYLGHPNPVLRRHAAWACRRIGRADVLAPFAGDDAVAGELAEAAPEART